MQAWEFTHSGPGSQRPRLDRKMCVIGFKDQAGAPAGVRSSPELWGQESDSPWAEGGLGWWRQGVCVTAGRHRGQEEQE